MEGAGNRVRDPSDELNALPAAAYPPGVAELSAPDEGIYDEHARTGNRPTSSNPMRGGEQKYGLVATSSPPHSPQELPA